MRSFRSVNFDADKYSRGSPLTCDEMPCLLTQGEALDVAGSAPEAAATAVCADRFREVRVVVNPQPLNPALVISSFERTLCPRA